jgi:hypothetical protein
MTSAQRFTKFAALGLATTLLAGGVSTLVPPVSLAQTGLTIFGGIEPEYRLRYLIDFNHVRSNDARYYLRVSGEKMVRDVISMEIDYPPEFVELNGSFDENKIELRQGSGARGGDVIPTRSITWMKDQARIEIIPEEPIPEGTDIVIAMRGVTNPRRYGYHYFNLRLMYQGDVVNQYVGTWPLEVAVDSTRDD